MELKDLIITPLLILFLSLIAFIIQPYLAPGGLKRYFFPALTVKFIGAIALGLIYQFYYGAGDTFNFYHNGSLHIWNAFLDSPAVAIDLIFNDGTYTPENLEYAQKIWFFNDSSSFFVVKVSAIFGFFTFHSYSAIAVLFAVFSFSGSWALFRSILKFYPRAHKHLALSIFFIPSVVFWGSGLMKDTLTLGALGWLTAGVIGVFFDKKRIGLQLIIIILSAWIIIIVKVYIILCFIPPALIWVSYDRFTKIKQVELKIILLPVIAIFIIGFSYLAIREVGESSYRYSLENLSTTVEVTARWINYSSELQGGTSYTLGDFDYSPQGIARKVLPGIFVTLFQPMLWEANNPVMLISALENTALLFITILILFKGGLAKIRPLLTHNSLFLFAFFFSLTFAAAVGFSTYNYGSLVRYKIPLLPFYGILLTLIHYYGMRRKN